MSPFRATAFRRLWYSTLAIATAQGIERTATAWLTIEAGGGAFAIGLTFAARMLPSLLFGLAAGTIADRGERARQLLAVAGVSLATMVMFGWLIGTGGLQVWQVVAFSFVAGCIQVFDTPARQALVLDTVEREVAARALALNALGARILMALGAFLAGFLIPWLGVGRCYWVAALLYGLVVILTAIIRVPQTDRTGTQRPPFFRAFSDAARLIVDVPVVRVLILSGLVCEIFAFSHSSALPLFAQDVLKAGAEGLGTMNAALAIGGAVSVALVAMLPARQARQPLLGSIFLVYGLAILSLALTRHLGTVAVILVITGMCAGGFDVLQQTLIQMAVPDEQRGRAVGIWVLGLGSAPIGHLEMGLLVGALGPAGALLINGTLTVIAAIILLIYAPTYRWGIGRQPRPVG